MPIWEFAALTLLKPALLPEGRTRYRIIAHMNFSQLSYKPVIIRFVIRKIRVSILSKYDSLFSIVMVSVCVIYLSTDPITSSPNAPVPLSFLC